MSRSARAGDPATAPAPPAVVVVAYDRPASLGRLLASVAQARYATAEVPLVVSVDGGLAASLEVAGSAPYTHGPRELLARPSRMGLRGHVLSCGDLATRFGSIVLLEDDLAVSPAFHEFAHAALAAYADDEGIAGVSLYSYAIAESSFGPFEALDDGTDVFFMQFPSSWGVAWTAAQWQRFRTWLERNPAGGRLPAYVERWPATSWKKDFARYMVAEDRYMVYPRTSFSTNFGEAGRHDDRPGLWQVALSERGRPYRLPPRDQSGSVYDAFFEPSPGSIRRRAPQLPAFDVDLYGVKDDAFLAEDLVLTTRECDDPVETFGLQMFPAALNVTNRVRGAEIRLAPRESRAPALPRHAHSYYRLSSVLGSLLAPEDFPAPPRLAISVVIPVVSGGPALAATLAAVLSQDWDPSLVEIVLVDLRAESVPEGPPPPRTRWVRPERTIPPTPMAAACLGFRRACGDIFTLLPEGLAWEQGTLGTAFALLADPALAWVASLGDIGGAPRSSLRIAGDDGTWPSDLADLLDRLPFGAAFWKQHLWRDLEEGPGFDEELQGTPWAAFQAKAPVQLVDTRWLVPAPHPQAIQPIRAPLPRSAQGHEAESAGSNDVAASSGTVDGSPPRGPRDAGIPEVPATSLLRRATQRLARPVFERGTPIVRLAFPLLALAPYLLLFDTGRRRFRVWHYPPR